MTEGRLHQSWQETWWTMTTGFWAHPLRAPITRQPSHSPSNHHCRPCHAHHRRQRLTCLLAVTSWRGMIRQEVLQCQTLWLRSDHHLLEITGVSKFVWILKEKHSI